MSVSEEAGPKQGKVGSLARRPRSSLGRAGPPHGSKRCFRRCGLAAGSRSRPSAASSPPPPARAVPRSMPRPRPRPRRRPARRRRRGLGWRRTSKSKTSTGAAAPTGRPPPTSSSPCPPSSRRSGERPSSSHIGFMGFIVSSNYISRRDEVEWV